MNILYNQQKRVTLLVSLSLLAERQDVFASLSIRVISNEVSR